MKEISRELRIDILRMFYVSKTGHLAPALSCVDILAELYFDGIIRWEQRFDEDRDRVILSKGHACAALYAVLAKAGYFPYEELMTFYQKNTRLLGLPSVLLPGIETPTGSLGQGICFATGTALAAKVDENDARTYVILGDGESEEGAVWEAAQFAANHELDNLTVVMDRNRLQASTWVEEIAPLEPVATKWQAFGWQVLTVDGHDFAALHEAFHKAQSANGQPTLIIANTIKGKGLSFAENNPDWHSHAPTGEEWQQAAQELGITLKELKTI